MIKEIYMKYGIQNLAQECR